MSIPDLEHVVRQLTNRGVRVLEADENTPEMVLGIIREQRRRHAHQPRTRAMNSVAGRLSDELVDAAGVDAADIARVLAALASRLGALAIAHGVPDPMLCELIIFAADDCDRRATGAEPEPRTP